MNILYICIILAVVFLLQSVLGFLQIQNFVKEFRKMCKKRQSSDREEPQKDESRNSVITEY